MTELIWDGKYDSDGKKTAPLRVALPFQTVETVNESAQQRQIALDLFSAGRDAEWRNRLRYSQMRYNRLISSRHERSKPSPNPYLARRT
jgi:hypothetical protein